MKRNGRQQSIRRDHPPAGAADRRGRPGNPVYRDKNLRYIKPDAADQGLFDVARALAGLQEYTLSKVSRIDTSQLVQV